MSLRLTANISFMFAEQPFLERFAAAAKAGFRAVECHWPYEFPIETLQAAISAAGVKLTGLNMPVGDKAAGDFGLAAVPGREAEFKAAFDLAVRYATALGCPMIHVLAGNVADDQHGGAIGTYIANLRHAAAIAEKQKLTLLIEPINRRDAPNYFLSTLEEAVAVAATLSSPAVKIMADLYHLQIMGGDLVTRLADCIDMIGHVQVAGVPARAEPDQGEVNLRFVLDALAAAGYTGLVAAEYRPRGRTEDGLGWIAASGLTFG